MNPIIKNIRLADLVRVGLLLVWAAIIIGGYAVYSKEQTMRSRIDKLQHDVTAQRRIIVVMMEHQTDMDAELASIRALISEAVEEK